MDMSETINNCTPHLRFPGCTGKWETPSIDEVFDVRNGYTPSKYVAEYWEGGTIPWFRMEDIRENGGILTDAIQHITPQAVKGSGLFKKNSIILATTATIGVHAMVIADSLANQRFTNFSIRKSLIDKYSPMFVYYAFYGIDEWCKRNTNAGGLLSVNMPALLKQPFFTPSLDEQIKIAECLEAEDQMIFAQEQKVESLKAHKKGLMQQLFPQSGETTPRLRFPGFTGEWEEKKMGDVFTRITRRNTENNQNVLTISAQYGLISQLDFFKKSVAAADVTGYYLLNKGEFAYNKSSSQGRPFGAIKPLRLYDKGVVSTLYICFKCNDPMEIDFWDQYFDAGLLDKELLSIAQEGARNHGLLNIPTSGFFGLSVLSPSIDEQQKIASCLSTLDDAIRAENDKLEALKDHKKGLMQHLFPNSK
mgnify:CR=1 FL=1